MRQSGGSKPKSVSTLYDVSELVSSDVATHKLKSLIAFLAENLRSWDEELKTLRTKLADFEKENDSLEVAMAINKSESLNAFMATLRGCCEKMEEDVATLIGKINDVDQETDSLIRKKQGDALTIHQVKTFNLFLAEFAEKLEERLAVVEKHNAALKLESQTIAAELTELKSSFGDVVLEEAQRKRDELKYSPAKQSEALARPQETTTDPMIREEEFISKMQEDAKVIKNLRTLNAILVEKVGDLNTKFITEG